MAQNFLTDRTNIIQVGGSTVTLGQKTEAQSLPVTLASDQALPLPASAATSTKQSDGTQKTQIVDGSGNVIAATSNALNVTNTAGTAIIGYVGTTVGTTVALTPTISASPDYSALDVVGGIQTIASANSSTGRPIKLKSLVVKDKNGQSPAMTFLFFKATPSGGTYTDNGALTLGTNDMANMVGVVKVVAGDYYTPVSGATVAALGAVDQVMAVSATSLFALIIADAAINAASTSDFTIEFGIEQL